LFAAHVAAKTGSLETVMCLLISACYKYILIDDQQYSVHSVVYSSV